VHGVSVWDFGACGLAWRPGTDADGQGRAVTGGGPGSSSWTTMGVGVDQARPAPS
jgi:hypothetical protein